MYDETSCFAQACLSALAKYCRAVLYIQSQTLAKITGLSMMPMQIEDWVVVADMDEFFIFGIRSQTRLSLASEIGITADCLH